MVLEKKDIKAQTVLTYQGTDLTQLEILKVA
jgi:hypothetical protein